MVSAPASVLDKVTGRTYLEDGTPVRVLVGAGVARVLSRGVASCLMCCARGWQPSRASRSA